MSNRSDSLEKLDAIATTFSDSRNLVPQGRLNAWVLMSVFGASEDVLHPNRWKGIYGTELRRPFRIGIVIATQRWNWNVGLLPNVPPPGQNVHSIEFKSCPKSVRTNSIRNCLKTLNLFEIRKCVTNSLWITVLTTAEKSKERWQRWSCVSTVSHL